LKTAWSRTKAGKGGYASLAGFEFQITQAVLELIRSEGGDGGLVLMEVLSDILRQDGGLVVSQLKRTLSSGALHKALDELWDIEQLARSVVPDIRPSLRFQVQAAYRDLRDVEASIRRWMPASLVDADHLSAFKLRVQGVVVAAPRLEAARLLVEKFVDPTPFVTVDKLAGILLRASDAAAMEAAAAEIRVVLAAMKASATKRAVEFQIWGQDDRAPAPDYEPDARKAVRIGQRLTVADLVAGRLAYRSSYGTIHAAAEEWLTANADGADKIPTFWIEGRSGAGKSAALLHLLAKLRAEDPQRLIVWLGPRSERFGDVLRRFRDVIEDGRQLIIAIDDPLAPDQQQAFIAAAQAAADEWTRLSGSGDGDPTPQPPCLVCCGPTEQREFGEDNCYAELDITPWPLAPESAEDIEELAVWYTRRTGNSPPMLEGDVLLVQRFFEWDVGNLRDFALRFRKRLQNLGAAGTKVFDLVAGILAFGRLYADYPAHLLQAAMTADQDVSGALDRLAEEEAHLTFRADGEGVRLTHPHLADAIYREWFGRPSDKAVRKRHLAEGIRGALAQVERDPGARLAPLWAIARLKRGPESGRHVSADLRERLVLIDVEVRELLGELYAGIGPGQAGPSELPVWMVLDEAFGLGLSPSPSALLKDVIDKAGAPQQGLRLGCHIMLASGRREDANALRHAVSRLLRRLVDWRDDEGRPWRDWAYVASDLIHKGGASLITDDLLRLIDRASKWPSLRVPILAVARKAAAPDAMTVVSAWLAATQDHPQHWPGVLRALHDRKLPVTDLNDRMARFLLAVPHHPAWPTIWKSALEGQFLDRDHLNDLGLAWLGLKPETGIPVASFEADNYYKIIGALLSAKPVGFEEALQRLGLDWVEEVSPLAGGWSAVWNALWEDDTLSMADLERLRAMGFSALETFPRSREWSFIWHGFVHKRRDTIRADVLAIGQNWLKTVPNRHAGWVFVWETLDDQAPRHSPSRPELRDLANQWLVAAPQHRGWASIWEKQRQNPANDKAALFEMGRDWLAQASIDHPAWRFVAHVVISKTPASDPFSERFAQAAHAWLRSNPDDPRWPRMFSDACHLLSPEEAESFEAESLERSQRTGGPPPRLVRALLRRAEKQEQREALLVGLLRWLADHPDHPEWSMGWTTLAYDDDRPVSIETLCLMADKWSQTNGPITRGWPYLWPIWRYLLRAHKPEELPARAPDALTCLMSLPLTHTRWFQVWNALRYDDPDLLTNSSVLSRQAAWLRQPVRDANKWSEVFKFYHEAGGEWTEDPELASCLLDWLEIADATERRWPEIWRAAHNLDRADLSRLNKAMNWLSTQPSTQPGWPFVWRLLARAPAARTLDQDKVLALGRLWMAENDESHHAWPKMKEMVDKFGARVSADGQPTERTRVRTRAPSALGRWLSLRHKSQEEADRLDRGELLDLVMTANLAQRGWTLAWKSFVSRISAEETTAQLGERGMSWLERKEDTPAWPFVWRDLWTHWPKTRPRLTPMGREWLRGRSFTTPGRDFIQKKLFGRLARKKKTPEA